MNQEPVYMTEARAECALDLAEPLILQLMASGITSRKFIHVVIPSLVDGTWLAERSIGRDTEEYKDSCRHIARSKATIHLREGLPSQVVQARRAASLLIGDTVHGGSFAHEDVVVAASGVQGYYDETISAMVAAILWGLIQQEQERFMEDRGAEYVYRRSIPLYQGPLAGG